MDDSMKKTLADKNNKLIDMVIERIKRDFIDDIVLVGLTGSFLHGDFNQKSDLDLVIIHDTARFGKLWETFIFDDVSYSFFYISWSNLERKAALENVGVSGLTDTQIIYSAKSEYLEKFNALKEKAITLMAKPYDYCMGIQ